MSEHLTEFAMAQSDAMTTDRSLTSERGSGTAEGGLNPRRPWDGEQRITQQVWIDKLEAKWE